MPLSLHELAHNDPANSIVRLTENGFEFFPAPTQAEVKTSLIPTRPLEPGEQYRFHFDMTRCIGCRSCEVACNEQNNTPPDQRWRRIGEIEGGTYPNTERFYLSMGCNHCLSAECIKGCPVDAYTKDPVTGIVLHSADACIGCQYCVWNCSYSVPQFNPERGIVGKCDMCHGRLTDGLEPACVNACPEAAIEIEIVAKEPPDIEHQTLRQHLSCLFEADGWIFNLIYIITFGGFLGLATFLPSFYYSQFHVTKVQAGSLTVLATLTGSLTRVLGGWFADRVGGITTLFVVFLIAVGGLFGLMTTPSPLATTLLFMLCFAALGAGNGATFQLVPLRWPLTTAVAGGMIGEIGALGGGILPNLLGQSKQHTNSYRVGFLLYAVLAIGVLVVIWTVSRSWIAPGGRAVSAVEPEHIEEIPA